jgi:hypothetical protein
LCVCVCVCLLPVGFCHDDEPKGANINSEEMDAIVECFDKGRDVAECDAMARIGGDVVDTDELDVL